MFTVYTNATEIISKYVREGGGEFWSYDVMSFLPCGNDYLLLFENYNAYKFY